MSTARKFVAFAGRQPRIRVADRYDTLAWTHVSEPLRTEAMIATQVARIIADYVVFLELSDEDTLNPDAAVKMMEALAADLEALDQSFLRELVDAFAVIAAEYSGGAQEVVRNIAHSYYLEEALAADDPVRLAELEARREAED